MSISQRYHPYWAVYISLQEGWYHFIAILFFVPTANYLLIGPAYLTDWQLFGKATLLVLSLYVPIATLLTIVIRVPIRRYPEVTQTNARAVLMLLLTSILTSIYATGAVWILSRVSYLPISFTRNNVGLLIGLGLAFDVLFCLAHSYFYTRSKWHDQQLENEQLKKETVQLQLDTLKTQINPHFLFNSLTSLSTLIGEDRESAEHFVDELAKVYRYLLHPDRLTTTAPGPGRTGALIALEAEISFINSYTYLLKTRYGKGISVSLDVNLTNNTYYLPPLTLQILLENAVRHNVISAAKPLQVEIRLTDDGRLMVRNTLQKRPIRVASNQAGLCNIITKYQLLNNQSVSVQATETHFIVLLPLLADQQVLMAS